MKAPNLFRTSDHNVRAIQGRVPLCVYYLYQIFTRFSDVLESGSLEQRGWAEEGIGRAL
jgi:hypothetical protein